MREPLAAEIGFGQLAALDHRAHRAVEDEDAFGEQLRSRVSTVVIVIVSFCRVLVVLVFAFFVADREQHGERIVGAPRAQRDARRR